MSSMLAPKPTTAERRELFIWTFKHTTHNAFSTHQVQACRWDLLFDTPHLSELFAHRQLASHAADIDEISKTEVIFQTLGDISPATERWLKRSPLDRCRSGSSGDFGPYWVLLPVGNLPSTHVSYYQRFHIWVRDIKRSLALSLSISHRLAHFNQYLVFNEEVDREIARSSEDGTCPVREWNRSTYERAPWGR